MNEPIGLRVYVYVSAIYIDANGGPPTLRLVDLFIAMPSFVDSAGG